jgi:hypothetical protein
MPIMDDSGQLLEEARLLLSRLERLSADSTWAHRASGVRGALLRCVEGLEAGGEGANEQAAHLEDLVRLGTIILNHAAREIRVPEKSRFR